MRIRWMIAACSAVALGFPGAGHAGGPETFAHALTRHHIALTKSALLEALQNPDAEVRGLAAWQLAETKQKDCLPQILQAARDEKNPDTRVNIASAAGNLGSTEGDALLERICKDPGAAGLTRIDAARHLFDDHSHACMPELWQMMEPGVDPSVRTSALTLVAQRHDLTPEETDHVFNETLAALRDSDVSLKLYAIYMLDFLQDVRAVPALQTAIQVEKEETVRPAMESTLKRLLAIRAGRK